MTSTRTRKALFILEEKHTNEWDGTVSWSQIAELVAVIKPRSGTIQVEGQKEEETVKYEVLTPWRAGVFKTQVPRRLVHEDGRKFYIESIIDVDEAHREFKLTCTVR